MRSDFLIALIYRIYFGRLIKENKNIKKDAENKLFLKKKEMEIMTRMDMKTVNKLLLNDDVSNNFLNFY